MFIYILYYLSVFLSVHLSFYLSIFLPVYLSLCLSGVFINNKETFFFPIPILQKIRLSFLSPRKRKGRECGREGRREVAGERKREVDGGEREGEGKVRRERGKEGVGYG